MHHIIHLFATLGVFFVAFFVMLLAISVYLAPAFCAFLRGHKYRWRIAVLNVLFGWTFVGWFVTLVWAWSGDGSLTSVLD